MGRRKQPIDVPATTAEAAALIADYVAAEHRSTQIAGNYAKTIAELKADCALILAPIETGQKDRFAAIKSWWEASGRLSTGAGPNGRRSVELAGAKLGMRRTPPKVKLARGIQDGAIITWLRGQWWLRPERFLRPRVELDKPAIIKAAQAEAELRGLFETQGLTVVQADEFFIDAGIPAPAPAAVDAENDDQPQGI